LPCCTRSAGAWRLTVSLGLSATSCPADAWHWPIDGALAGLRIVNEILVAAERARQNGGPEHYVGDRVMEGLKLAALALTNHAIYRLHPE